MSGTNIPAPAPQSRGFVNRRMTSVTGWLMASFVVSLTLAVTALGTFGDGETGTALALRVTARWCFLLFWFAYAGGALAKSCGPCFGVLGRHGREFGLAFAAALVVHVGLVLWLLDVAADQQTLMLFFWAGVACTALLTLFSLPRPRDWLGPRLLRILSEAAVQYIALVFAVDFIVDPLQASGVERYPLSYLPFVIILIGGAALRLAAQIRRQPTSNRV
jgi:hypothetical protein